MAPSRRHWTGAQLSSYLALFLILSCDCQTTPKSSRSVIARNPVIDPSPADRPGPCLPTHGPPPGYSSISQLEGLWYRRFRGRIYPGEPPVKCSYNRLVYLGNGTLIDNVNKQYSETGEWKRYNETNALNLLDQSTWMNLGSKWTKRLLFFDATQGVSLIFACINTTFGHRRTASLYSRTPDVALTPAYLNTTWATFAAHRIDNIVPDLLPVNHSICQGETLPAPTHLPLANLTAHSNTTTSKDATERPAKSKMVFNNGQEKEGPCQAIQAMRPPLNYTSIGQFEGVWYRRYRSRGRPREPLLKCSYNRYVYQGNFTLVNEVAKMNSDNAQWTHLNETNQLNGNDTSTWTNTASNAISRVLFLDTNRGIAAVYGCANTANGHRNVGSIYSRSPLTPISTDYLQSILDTYSANGIIDILPLHPVDQEACQGEKIPAPTHGPDGRPLVAVKQDLSQCPACSCPCPTVAGNSTAGKV